MFCYLQRCVEYTIYAVFHKTMVHGPGKRCIFWRNKGQIENQDKFLAQKQVLLNLYFSWTWKFLHNSWCMELIFTSQRKLSIKSRMQPSLHPNCLSQITFAKFNIKIHYPPHYTCAVRQHQDSNEDLIRQSIMNLTRRELLQINT